MLGWIAAGVPVVMAGDRLHADRYVARLLFIAARRRWREARALVEAVEGQFSTGENSTEPADLAEAAA